MCYHCVLYAIIECKNYAYDFRFNYLFYLKSDYYAIIFHVNTSSLVKKLEKVYVSQSLMSFKVKSYLTV